MLAIAVSIAIYFGLNKVPAECGRRHINDNLQLIGGRDAVPDEETARKFADIIFDSEDWLFPGSKEESALFPDGYFNTVEITFNEILNEWVVAYGPQYAAATLLVVRVRKDCGMITVRYE